MKFPIQPCLKAFFKNVKIWFLLHLEFKKKKKEFMGNIKKFSNVMNADIKTKKISDHFSEISITTSFKFSHLLIIF